MVLRRTISDPGNSNDFESFFKSYNTLEQMYELFLLLISQVFSESESELFTNYC